MASTDEIIEKAQALGKMIAEHPAAQKMSKTLEQLKADTDAQRALNDFNRHVQIVSEKQAKNEPIEVEDKRKLEALQLAVVKHPLLRDFQMVQMDYVDLMRQVDTAIQAEHAITPADDLGGMAS